jgi:hypothetical protein
MGADPIGGGGSHQASAGIREILRISANIFCGRKALKLFNFVRRPQPWPAFPKGVGRMIVNPAATLSV